MKLRNLLTALTAATVQCLCAAQPAPPIAARNIGAAVLNGSTAFDFTSSINARQYRILVSVPPGFDTSQRYGVLYVLDGNQYFGTTSEAVARQSFLKTIKAIIVVGIGYQSNEFAVANRERWLDLTHSPSQVPTPNKTGGGAAFQKVLLEEVRPFIVSSYPVDSSAEALWGQSLGGLFALHLMLEKPEAFAAYIFSSPSIWWNKKEVLAGLEGLPLKLTKLGAKLRVLVTSAADEQPRSTGPEFVYNPAQAMVDDATELSIRLGRSNPQYLSVSRTIFDGEVHNTVSPASLSRSLRYLFAQDTKK